MPQVPAYAQVTSLVARALQVSPDALTAGFRPATQADFPQVLALRSQVLGAQISWDDEAYLHWRYRFGSATQGRGECWVVSRGETVLGVLGSEPMTVRHNGFAIDGISAMDLAVRPDIDGVGLGPWMVMAIFRTAPFTIAIGSNQRSRAIVSRVMTRLPDRRSYSYYTMLQRRLRQRLRSRWAAATVDLLAQSAMKSWRAFSIPAGSNLVTIRRIERFDASVDSLIARARDPRELSIDRSQEFLNWRLFANPRTAYTVLGAYHGELLIGYMAVHVVSIAGGGHDLAIEDWLVDPLNEGQIALRVLLGTTIDMALREGCENVTAIACHEPSEQVIRRIGFRAHSNAYETLSVNSNDAGLNEAIAAETPWHISGAHTDRDV